MSAVETDAEDSTDPFTGDADVILPEIGHVTLLDGPVRDKGQAEGLVEKVAAEKLARTEDGHLRGIDAPVQGVERVAVLPVGD